MAKAQRMQVLRANDPIEAVETAPENFLSEAEITEAMAPYVVRGVKVDITDEHWFLTLKKQVRTTKGVVIGEGDIKIQGTRKMPMRDLIHAADEFMVPLTPITPNPV